MMVKFHETLSDQTVYLRYFHAIGLTQRVSHERLARICCIDYDDEMVMVAEAHDPPSPAEIIAVGRLNRFQNSLDAEIAILVSDSYQGLGLGTEILRRLGRVGQDQRLQRIVAEILPENRGVQRIFAKLGYVLHYEAEEGVVRAELDLKTSQPRG